jgi:hypothetical protein
VSIANTAVVSALFHSPSTVMVIFVPLATILFTACDFAEPASILGIAGIVSTVAVGILIFLLQKRADNKINKIITSEDYQRSLQKEHLCNIVLNNLNRIKDMLQQTKTIVQAFPANFADENFLNESRTLVLLSDFGIANRIPEILVANASLINHFADLGLHEELKTVEAFRGPTVVMRDHYLKGDIYGGLRDDVYRKNKIFIIDGDLQLIENFSERIQRELTGTSYQTSSENHKRV